MEPNAHLPPKAPTNTAKNLHTFQSDLADVIKNEQGSLVKIAIAESDRAQRERDGTIANPKNKKLLMASMILVGLAMAIGIGILIRTQLRSAPIAPAVSRTALIPSESDTLVSLDGLVPESARLALVAAKNAVTTPVGSLTQLIATAGTESAVHRMTATELWNTLGITLPPSLARALGDACMIGVDAYATNNLFIVLTNDSYPTSFSGMLAWERTLYDDTRTIFGLQSDPYLKSQASFKDRVIKNQDARALLDESGKPVLFYTFLGTDKNLIFIGTSDATLAHVIGRMK